MVKRINITIDNELSGLISRFPGRNLSDKARGIILSWLSEKSLISTGMKEKGGE